MKNIFIVVLIFMSGTTIGQNFKGYFIIDGNVSYTSAKRDNYVYEAADYTRISDLNFTDVSITDIGISPAFGYGISEHFILGLGFNISARNIDGIFHSSSNSLSYSPDINPSNTDLSGYPSYTTKSESINESTMGVNIYARYYKEIRPKLLFSTKLNLGWEKLDVESRFLEYPEVNRLFGEISPAINYEITNRFLIYLNFASIGYSINKYTYYYPGGGTEKANEFYVDYQPSSWSYGLIIKIPGKKE